jgi:hypothetical protein
LQKINEKQPAKYAGCFLSINLILLSIFVKMQSPGVRYGILGGIAVVFYFAILYFSNKALFLNPGFQWGSLVIYLLFMYRAAVEDCAANGATRDFSILVRTPFITFLLVNVAYYLFFYAIHLADKSLIVMELDANIKMLQAQIQAGTGDPVQANELRLQIADLEKLKVDPHQALGPVILQMAQGAIGGFGLSASIAAILRR